MNITILNSILLFIVAFWFVRTLKAVLFWLYLWQLKEYHIGRFLDYFRTQKGKQSLFNKLTIFKSIVLLVVITYALLSSPSAMYEESIGNIILALALSFFFYITYPVEGMRTVRQYLSHTLLKPVWTKKTLVLFLILSVVFLAIAVYAISSSLVILLLFDILTPVVVSLVVMGLQPFTVLGRNRLIAQAKQKRDHFKNLMVIGITGSYGKTSTKDFLSRILSQKFKVLKTKEHQNSEVGISQCILNELKPEHEVFVCEMGAYNKGGIKLLAGIAKPAIGVLTGINEQHMATFGSQENIIKTKYELIESLPSNGVAFFNAKNTYCVELYNKTALRKVLYGQSAKFSGEENILGAMAVAKELGMSDEEIARAAKGIENIFPGTQVKKGKDGLTIIEATYSSNPTGVLANLEYLKTF
ncbi:MAG: Mur ligase family protein, partial [bacterium]|nr:Mur ligase family protein [bacterium]